MVNTVYYCLNTGYNSQTDKVVKRTYTRFGWPLYQPYQSLPFT